MSWATDSLWFGKCVNWRDFEVNAAISGKFMTTYVEGQQICLTIFSAKTLNFVNYEVGLVSTTLYNTCIVLLNKNLRLLPL